MPTFSMPAMLSHLIRASTFAGLASALVVCALSAGAEAGELGKCDGVDSVEADLQQSSSSGYFIPGLKLIILNRVRLNESAPAVQKFIFNHECAHADPAVGSDESAADCAAAKKGRAEGWLGRTEIIQVCVHLSHMPVDDTHPPIAVRCANIRRCTGDIKDTRQLATDQATLLPSDILRR